MDPHCGRGMPTHAHMTPHPPSPTLVTHRPHRLSWKRTVPSSLRVWRARRRRQCGGRRCSRSVRLRSAPCVRGGCACGSRSMHSTLHCRGVMLRTHLTLCGRSSRSCRTAGTASNSTAGHPSQSQAQLSLSSAGPAQVTLEDPTEGQSPLNLVRYEQF